MAEHHLWEIRTLSSTYLIDMNEGLLLRIPGDEPAPNMPAASRLRLDGLPIQLLSIDACDVGRSMIVLLKIRRDGVLTRRTTTAVKEVRRLAP